MSVPICYLYLILIEVSGTNITICVTASTEIETGMDWEKREIFEIER